MDEIFSIIVGLAFVLIPAVLQVIDKKSRAGKTPQEPAGQASQKPAGQAPVRSVPVKTQVKKPAAAVVPGAPAGGGRPLRDALCSIDHNTESVFRDDKAKDAVAKERIDKRRLIVYSELMKPKFDEL